MGRIYGKDSYSTQISIIYFFSFFIFIKFLIQYCWFLKKNAIHHIVSCSYVIFNKYPIHKVKLVKKLQNNPFIWNSAKPPFQLSSKWIDIIKNFTANLIRALHSLTRKLPLPSLDLSDFQHRDFQFEGCGRGTGCVEPSVAKISSIQR